MIDPSTLRQLAAGNHWVSLWPEIGLGCLGLALLVLEIVLPPRAHRAIPAVAMLGQFAILAGVLAVVRSAGPPGESFGGLVRLSTSGQAMRAYFLVSSLFVSLLAWAGRKPPRTEFYATLLVIAAALMLFIQSSHFVMLFVALETLTVGFYVLVSHSYDDALSLEAGLKYLIMGALSSALLLFGIVLLYGVAGNPSLPGHTAHGLHYPELTAFLAANPHDFLASAGIVLVLSGLAFKIGAFPFQFWIPDVYQGAPTPVTALLAVASKAGGFVVLLNLVTKVFAAYVWLTAPVLGLMAAATILFGNLAALTQGNVKRLIGLSGVSHAGFILLGVLAAIREPLGAGAVYFYLIAYLMASFAVFGVMACLAGDNDADQVLDDYSGLYRKSPFLAGVLAIGLGSLAGIPPLAGFMGKFLVFVAAFKAGHAWLLVVAIAGVVASIYYYFGWIRSAFFDPDVAVAGLAEAGLPGSATPATARVLKAALLLLALGSVVLGFYQGPIGRWLAPM